MTEEEQIKIIRKNPFNIKHINNPTKEVQLVAVNQDGYTIHYINDPYEEVQLAAINQHVSSIHYIKYPSKDALITALLIILKDGDINAIDAVEELLEKYSDRNYPELIAINNYRRHYNMTEEEQIRRISKNPYYIRYIKNPSEKVQLAAVQDNAKAIRFIDNPSEEVQLIAVRKDAYAIFYIKNPTKKVLITALLIIVKDGNYEYVEEFLDNYSNKNYPELIAINNYMKVLIG